MTNLLIFRKALYVINFIVDRSFYSLSITCLLIFIFFSYRWDYFPENKEDLIYGEYKVGYIGRAGNGGGTLVNLYGKDGSLLKYHPVYARYYTDAYAMMKSIAGKDEYIKVGWYSGCLLGRINMEWPCPIDVLIEKDGKIYLDFNESKRKFEQRSKIYRVLRSYFSLICSCFFLFLGFVFYLLKQR